MDEGLESTRDVVQQHLLDVPDNRLNRTLFVGGLDEDLVDKQTLHDAFAIFGEIRTTELPINRVKEKHRGFGFVEFEEVQDAREAIENMDGAELKDRILTVNLARNIEREDTRYTSRPPWIAEYLRRKQAANSSLQ